MCRLSDRPETAMFIARSMYPMLLSRLYRDRCEHDGDPDSASLSHMLDSLRSDGVIDTDTHINLRLGSVAITEFGSKTQVDRLISGLRKLLTIANENVGESLAEELELKQKRISERYLAIVSQQEQPDAGDAQLAELAPTSFDGFRRWAHAAAVVFSLGLWKSAS
ncbi:MAG: hypothetical protein AAFX06_26615 [Planctomycetota bacterium]